MSFSRVSGTNSSSSATSSSSKTFNLDPPASKLFPVDATLPLPPLMAFIVLRIATSSFPITFLCNHPLTKLKVLEFTIWLRKVIKTPKIVSLILGETCFLPLLDFATLSTMPKPTTMETHHFQPFILNLLPFRFRFRRISRLRPFTASPLIGRIDVSLST